MTDLGRRVPTALLYAAVLGAAAFLRPEGLLVVAFVGCLAYAEASRLLGGSLRPGVIAILGVWVDRAASFWPASDARAFLALAAILLIVEGGIGGLKTLPRRTLLTAVGVAWVGLLMFLVDLGVLGAAGTGAHPDVPVWLLLAFLPTWAADVAAYAVGSVWGRHRLAPRISPGKTWEGTIAGFAAAAAAVSLLAVAFTIPAPSALVAALLIGPAGLAGDLVESAVKRSAGAKDSGTLLPGHGGVLDRVDSLIAVAPVVLVAAMMGR